MSGLRLKVGAQTYEVGPLTLGEHRAAKRIYGVADMGDLLAGDPDAIAAFIFTALRRADVNVSDDALVARIDTLDISDVEISDPDEPETIPESDPTPPPPVEVGVSDEDKPKPARKTKGSKGSG